MVVTLRRKLAAMKMIAHAECSSAVITSSKAGAHPVRRSLPPTPLLRPRPQLLPCAAPPPAAAPCCCPCRSPPARPAARATRRRRRQQRREGAVRPVASAPPPGTLLHPGRQHTAAISCRLKSVPSCCCGTAGGLAKDAPSRPLTAFFTPACFLRARLKPCSAPALLPAGLGAQAQPCSALTHFSGVLS